MYIYIVCLLLISILVSGHSETRAASVPVGKNIVHGVIISTHRGGQEWGYDGIVPTMADIRAVGANWVAIHPYARIQADGTVRFRAFDPAHPPAEILRPIREAHAQGLSICIKPHLAYWRSGFRWRGEIEFKTEEEWQRFWTEYRQWIIALAEVCKGADGFVVGTELDRTLDHETEWRDLIADVRAVFDGPLTYGANWTDYERVPFWDALDVIGIQAYFPLADRADPTEEDLRKGWAKRMADLRAYSIKMNRKILFTELGYNQSHLAPIEPWDDRTDGDDARPIQEACWQAALTAIEAEPRVVGALLWKWFPYPRPIGRNFQVAAPHIKRILSDHWGGVE